MNTFAAVFLLCSHIIEGLEHSSAQPWCESDSACDSEVSLIQTVLNATRKSLGSHSSKKRYTSRLYTDSNPLRPEQLHILDYNATFISNDGLLCSQGLIKTAIGSLALKQAGLTGMLFNESSVRSQTDCSSQGYTVSMGEDPTYREMALFVRSAEDYEMYREAQSQAVQAFAENNGLPLDTARLMWACTAQLQSEVERGVTEQCSLVDEISGSWMHRDLVDYQTMRSCDTGPFQKAVFALATLKTTPQFAQHVYDQILVGNCNDWGFMVPLEEDAQPDHCFAHFTPPAWALHFHYDEDLGYEPVMEDERCLGNGCAEYPDGFPDMGRAIGLDEDVITIMGVTGCHCLPESEVMEQTREHNNDENVCTTPEELPAIRTWWYGPNPRRT